MPKDLPILRPNLGLYYDRPSGQVPSRALSDGLNFRVKDGRISNRNLGWQRFSDNWTLNGPVTFIDNFFPRGLPEQLIFGTTTDIYLYDPDNDTVSFITPQYTTGTVSATGTTVTGSGTSWVTNADSNDEISIGHAGTSQVSPGGNTSITKVMLYMDGADAATAFLDHNAGGSAHTWTAAGNAQLDTADKFFGASSGLFDGTGDWITTPDSADYTLGTSNFEINIKFKISGGDGTLRHLAGQNDVGFTAAGSAWHLDRLAANTLRFSLSDGSTFTTITTAATYTTASNTGWHDLTVTRVGNVLYMFVDGTLVNAGGTAFTGTVPNSASVLGVGVAGAAAANGWFGWLDEFRFNVGGTGPSASFTPSAFPYNTPWASITNVGGATTLTISPTLGTIAAGASYTIRRKFSGSVADIWSFDTFVQDSVSGDDLWIGTNGIEVPVSWDGTGPMELQTALGFTCKVVAVFSNMMIYGNLVQTGDVLPSSIINSNVGSPLDVTTGLASQFRVHDGTDEILNMVPLADTLVIYNERHLVQAQFVGDPLVFIFREPVSGLGPVSHNGIADFGDYHEFLAQDAQYTFDGVGVKEINSQVWRDIIRQSDPSRRRRIFAHFDEEQGDLIWSVPLNTDPDSGTETTLPQMAWSEHYLEEVEDGIDQPHSKRQFPFTTTGYYEQLNGLTWADVVGTWEDQTFAWNDQGIAANFPLNLAGDDDGIIWTLNTAQTADGVGLPFNVRFGRVAMDTGRERSLLARVYPFFEETNQNVNVKVYMADHHAGPAIEKGTFAFDTSLPESTYFVSPFVRGRYVEIEFENEGEAVVTWGYDLDWRKFGGRR